jgi:Ca2+/Na+ antiporter
MFHTVLLLEDTNMEQFMRVMFGIMAGCFFVLLYNPGILFPVMILVLAFALYSSYYYDYEKKYKHDQ